MFWDIFIELFKQEKKKPKEPKKKTVSEVEKMRRLYRRSARWFTFRKYKHR